MIYRYFYSFNVQNVVEINFGIVAELILVVYDLCCGETVQMQLTEGYAWYLLVIVRERVRDSFIQACPLEQTMDRPFASTILNCYIDKWCWTDSFNCRKAADFVSVVN